jgi:hypothetical protein
MDGLMELHRYELDVSLEELVRDARRAAESWDWSRGAFGHALSLPAYRQLHPYSRYDYGNYPCAALLDDCPAFRQLFESLACEKVSFRLLRRGPSSSYGWHTDAWKGPGVARFQIPIVSDDSAFLVTTDYERVDQLQRPAPGRLNERSFDDFAGANAGHFRKHHLEPGCLYYFSTNRVHTLVNPGPGERITLSFDLLANDWLLARFPEVRGEIGEHPDPLPRPGRLRSGLSYTGSRLYPLRNLVRRRLRR